MTAVPDPSSARRIAIEVRRVGKRYPGVVALDAVSFAVAAGSIHALVGENGAGKSTLIKVMSGAVTVDEGEIRVDDRVVGPLTPRTAAAAGIAVIHQETQVAHDLSVTENLLMERLPRRAGLVHWRAAHRQAATWLDRVGFEGQPTQRVASLRPVDVKHLEIARALSLDARVLILDEPTAVLPARDARRLFALLRRLRSEGTAIVYISHHLQETLELADEVTVLRDGRLVRTVEAGSVDTEELVRLMLGGDRPEPIRVREVAAAAPVADRPLVLRAVDVEHGPLLRGVSIDVHAGEVVCVTGLADSGRHELARCLAGALRPTGGRVEVDGAAVGRPPSAVRAGIVFLPEDRKREGLFLDQSVLANAEIGPISRSASPWFAPAASSRTAAALLERLRVRAPSPRVAIRTLSGGNQQKVILARWLGVQARVYVFDEPTAGIDVGAKAEIYDIVASLARDGAAIVIFSSDFEEIRTVADRVLVLSRGTVVGHLDRDAIDDERMLSLEAA